MQKNLKPVDEIAIRLSQYDSICKLLNEYQVEDPKPRSYYNLRAAVKEVLDSFQQDLNLGA